MHTGSKPIIVRSEVLSAGTAVATVVVCGTGREPITAAIDAVKRAVEPMRMAVAA
jgi:hypothetical protein